jgi:hypothetical protein
MMLALAGEELPSWLEDALRVRLVAARGEALVAKATVRAAPQRPCPATGGPEHGY